MKAIKIILFPFLFIIILSNESFTQFYPPPGGYVTQPVQFRWPHVPGATSYAVSVYNFINLIRYAPATDTTISLTGFPENTTLSWKVTAKTGSDSSQSSLMNFTVVPLTIPTAPTLYSPPDNGTAANPVKFSWLKVPGAFRYRLQVALDNSFITPLFNDTLSDTFKVLTAPAAPVYWRVNAANAAGTGPYSVIWKCTIVTSIKKDVSIQPAAFKLYNNYPNPFNPVTTIRIDIPKECDGKLVLYDMQGKELEVLLDEHLKTGAYYILLNGDELSSGIYFIRFISEKFSDTKKIILLK